MLDALDPEVRHVVEPLNLPSFSAEGLLQIRSAPPIEFPEPEGIERRDHVIDELSGLRAQSYRPRDVTGELPCVIYLHGGGYILGSHVITAPEALSQILTFPCVYFSIDYRLAPETPYPGPLEDCYEGLRWLVNHADDLGVDRAAIGVRGASAGAGLAACLSLLVRERAELSLSFQVLECPMLDDTQTTRSSQLEGLPIWSKESNEFGWRSYLGSLYGSDSIPVTAAAARATDLRDLPPTYLCVGGVDGFRDEVIEYALKLSDAGVPTDLRVYAGAPHGLHLAAGSRLAVQWTRDLDEWLAHQLKVDARR
jgi:acetyl esterase/lipase